MKKTRIFIADDHPVFRDGIRSVLSKTARFTVVGEAQSGADAIKGALSMRPDVIVMDITMPDLDGITVTKRIIEQFPQARVVMLSMHSDVYHAIDAFRAGALGYVLKDSPPEELVTAVEKALCGGKYISREIAGEFIDDYVDMIKRDKAATDPFDALSEREREVVRQIADGRTSREIAEKLFISVATVKTHRNNIMKKLKVNSMAGMIRAAVRKGIVNPE